MYSRYHNRTDTPIQIPENYGGCAFSETGGSAAGGAAAHRIDVAKPTPPVQEEPPPNTDTRASSDVPPPPPSSDSVTCLLPTRKESEHRAKSDAEEAVTHRHEPREETEKGIRPPRGRELPTPLHTLFGKMGSAFPFSHGIGFDELLILGVILLLARNEDDSDLILWLVLLLFCG